MDNLCGIYSLRGYLYQIIVFAEMILNNISANTAIIYEGQEDIDIEKSDYSQIINDVELIQVKSGSVTNTILYGVVANWLINSDLANKKLKLIYEKGDLILDDDFFEKFYLYISDKERLKKDTKFTKCYNKYLGKKNSIKSDFDFYIRKAELLKTCFDEVIDDIYEFIKINYNLEKRTDIEAFGYYFCKRIVENVFINVKESKNYRCNYSDYNSIIEEILKNIKADKYIFDLEKYQSIDLGELVTKIDPLFFEQIKKVSKKKNFIITNIQAELEYELFRNSIEESNINLLKQTESTAKNNRMIQEGNEENINSNNLYYNTIKMPLNSQILYENNDSRIGCYNFLTSSKCPKNLRINWEVSDEEIE